jgi:hypothetical protein
MNWTSLKVYNDDDDDDDYNGDDDNDDDGKPLMNELDIVKGIFITSHLFIFDFNLFFCRLSSSIWSVITLFVRSISKHHHH